MASLFNLWIPKIYYALKMIIEYIILSLISKLITRILLLISLKKLKKLKGHVGIILIKIKFKLSHQEWHQNYFKIRYLQMN
jgi:hypothetical protein